MPVLKNLAITISGTPGCQLLSELEQAPGGFTIVKKLYSAFFGAPLRSSGAPIFNVVNAILLRPLPSRDSERFGAIYHSYTNLPTPRQL